MANSTPKIPVSPAEIPKRSTRKAGEEEAAMNRGDPLELLDFDGKKNDHRRRQYIFDILNKTFVIFIFAGVITVISLLIIWVLHITLPEKWRWLNGNDVQTIRTILFSGIFSAFLTISINRLRE